MATSATALLRQLESLKTEFGGDPARRKLELLGQLDRSKFTRARDLLRLHELLCFQRAYPDSPALLGRVEGMLSRFDRRKDLRRHRDELADTGLAGTAIHYRFYEPTMKWLRRRWGDLLTIDWPDFEKQDLLYERIDLLALYCESPGLDEHYESTRDWVDRLRGPEETDAAFLIRRFEALKMDEFTRQRFFEELDVPMTLAPGPDTPARTRPGTSCRLRRRWSWGSGYSRSR